MDLLEKEIISKYGVRVIPPEECMRVLEKAATLGVIDRPGGGPCHPMTTTELLEYISNLRRRFLYTEDFNKNMEEEVYESLDESKENDRILDNVMKAFIEYEKCRTRAGIEPVGSRGGRGIFLGCGVLVILLCVFGALSYTPVPY